MDKPDRVKVKDASTKVNLFHEVQVEFHIDASDVNVSDEDEDIHENEYEEEWNSRDKAKHIIEVENVGVKAE